LSRHRPRTFLFVLCSSVLFAAAAHGAALTSAIKTSATPATYALQIKGFIDQTAKSLTSADPLVQQDARRKLINECENHTGTPASPQFQSEYAKDLNKSLMGILKAANDVHTRVNVAVVVDEVALRILRGGGDVSRLSPLVQTLLSDKQTAVVLWGMKAAKQVMADSIQQGAKPTISSAIVKSLKAHLDAGVVVEEAYNALTIKVIQQGDIYDTVQHSPQFAATIVNVIPDLLDVITLRTQQFHSGTVPPSPQAEEVVSVFLSVTAYPAIAANAALLKRTLTVMGNLTCSVVALVSAGNNTPELIDVVREDGSFFFTIGQQMQGQGNQDASKLQDAAKLFSAISVNSDPTTMTKSCDGLTHALGAFGVTISSDGSSGAAPGPPVQPAILGSSK
jgi:hypothetical protein